MSFSMPYIEGTFAGSALAVDASTPNAAAPAAARAPYIVERGPRSEPPAKFTVCVANGTTITVLFWFLDNSVGKWIQLGSVTATPAAPGTLVVPPLANAQVFAQITANTGVTCFGYIW